jgi:hypothetical protein
MAEMKKSALMVVLVIVGVSIAAASSKISDDSYRLVRKLFAYKNTEIAQLASMTQYMIDCQGATDAQATAKNCARRMEELQTGANNLSVQKGVIADELATHIRQHKDEEWIFLGLLADDKEFSNLSVAH